MKMNDLCNENHMVFKNDKMLIVLTDLKNDKPTLDDVLEYVPKQYTVNRSGEFTTFRPFDDSDKMILYIPINE